MAKGRNEAVTTIEIRCDACSVVFPFPDPVVVGGIPSVGAKVITETGCPKCLCSDGVVIGQSREIVLDGGPRDGLVINTSAKDSIEVAYIQDSKAVRCSPDAPKPWTEINTVRYRSTFEWDEGREIYRPDWATAKTYAI